MGSICAGQRWRWRDHQECGEWPSIAGEIGRRKNLELVLEVIFHFILKGRWAAVSVVFSWCWLPSQ